LDESDLLDDSRDYLDMSMIDKKTATMSFIPHVGGDKLENLSTQSKVSSKYGAGKLSSSRYDKVVSPDTLKKAGSQQNKKDN